MIMDSGCLFFKAVLFFKEGRERTK